MHWLGNNRLGYCVLPVRCWGRVSTCSPTQNAAVSSWAGWSLAGTRTFLSSTGKRGICIRSGAALVGGRCCRRRSRRSRPGVAGGKNIRSGTWGRGCVISAIPCAPGGRMLGVGRHDKPYFRLHCARLFAREGRGACGLGEVTRSPLTR